MKHLSSIVLAVAVIAAGATACFKDPTSSLRNGPNRIELTRSAVFLNVGDSESVQAEVKDAQGNTYDAGDAVWATVDATIAAVRNDTTKAIPFGAFSRGFIRTTGPGKTFVTVTSHGITDSIEAVGVPLTFGGVITVPAGLGVGDTITVASTPALGFGAGTGLSIDGGAAWVVSQTATQMKLFPLVAASTGTYTFSGLLFIGTLPLTLSSPTAHPVAATNHDPNFPGDTGIATAPLITVPAAATAAAPYFWFGTLDGSTATRWYNNFKVVAPGGKALNVRLDFFGSGSGGSPYGSDPANPDLDVVVCGPSPAACSYGNDLLGNAAAGSSQPETATSPVLAAGTYIISVLGGTPPLLTYRLSLDWQ